MGSGHRRDHIWVGREQTCSGGRGKRETGSVRHGGGRRGKEREGSVGNGDDDEDDEEEGNDEDARRLTAS